MAWFKNTFGAKKPATTSPAAQGYEAQSGPNAGIGSKLYPGQNPFHYGVSIHFKDGGPDPLEGVSIYWNTEGPHWHYVSTGLASWGCELTFRLAATDADLGQESDKFLGAIAYNAPTWPIKMLNMLARRVHRSDRAFAHGHWWQGAPGVLQPYSNLEALLFARDPQLATDEASTQGVTWLQACAIDLSSIEAMKQDELETRGDAELERLAALDPLLITGRRWLAKKGNGD